MPEGPNLQGLWKRINEVLRKGEINRSLWESADIAKPLTLDGNNVVLGFKPADMKHAGYLTTPANRAQIVSVLRQLTNRNLNLEVIEGQTAEDWERYKVRTFGTPDEIAQQAAYRQAHGIALEAWEELNQALHKYYQDNMGIRRFPDQMARTLITLLPPVADAEDKARAADPTADQVHTTHLNKSFERLAVYCDMPATVVALEYMRYRSARKRQQG